MTDLLWDSEAYEKQRAIAEKLSAKGIRLALNQKNELTNEAREAYEDVLREAGYEV